MAELTGYHAVLQYQHCGAPLPGGVRSEVPEPHCFWGRIAPRLVLERCGGWERVDLSTFSGDAPRWLLSGVSLGELESLAPC